MPFFDPEAFLRGEQGDTTAKAAKVAKVEDSPDQTLAGLATLAAAPATNNSEVDTVGRGGDGDAPGAHCSICRDECRWCRTPGIEKCGACQRGAPIKDGYAAPHRPSTRNSRNPLLSGAVRKKIEAIEQEARGLGWPSELIWNGNFWDSPRGLAAVMDDDDEIAEVTADSIEILKTRRNMVRFYRRPA